jgi:hypothetical protein
MHGRHTAEFKLHISLRVIFVPLIRSNLQKILTKKKKSMAISIFVNRLTAEFSKSLDQLTTYELSYILYILKYILFIQYVQADTITLSRSPFLVHGWIEGCISLWWRPLMPLIMTFSA